MSTSLVCGGIRRLVGVWNQGRSVVLSVIATRVVIVIALVLAAVLPFSAQHGFFDNRALIAPGLVALVLPVYYAFCVPALVALVSLDRMLGNIRKGTLFSTANVRLLRVISWACFGAAAVLFVSVVVSIVFGFIGLLAVFFGLILRVVKNLFAAAVELKVENDYTI
jgi:TctA family transporter